MHGYTGMIFLYLSDWDNTTSKYKYSDYLVIHHILGLASIQSRGEVTVKEFTCTNLYILIYGGIYK